MLFAIVAVLFVGCKKETWKIHKEKINVGFTIKYSMPISWFSNRIENGMCMGVKPNTEEEEMKLIKESWCIWMASPEQVNRV